MPVYPFPGRSASSCTSPGCLCRDRRPAYPSDTTDEQWRVLRPEAETVMAGLVLAAGRPMVHDLRAMLDAVFYVARNGVEWRGAAAGVPPPPPGGQVFAGGWERGGGATPVARGCAPERR